MTKKRIKPSIMLPEADTSSHIKSYQDFSNPGDSNMAGERLKNALKKYRVRYQKAARNERTQLLTEFCKMTGYHRKYAISLLNKKDEPVTLLPRRTRSVSYCDEALSVVEKIWEKAGYPWSSRLVQLLPLWMPWARRHIRGITPEIEAKVLSISARQIDRRLQGKKRKLRTKIYGRTKPGSLLKCQIPVRTDNWDVNAPGYLEIDLVSHSGSCANGEFIYSLNVTDIHTCWCETRAIMGKGQAGVVKALDEIRQALPFKIKAIDSDNGSEFINHHLVRYCEQHEIKFTRSRPYRKNDNAYIEQKNWTHVRRIFGWDRLDTHEQMENMNRLYRNELSLMMNLFQPCTKLKSKERVGSKIRRRYEEPKTPLDRLLSAMGTQPELALRRYIELRDTTDPFQLSRGIEESLDGIHRYDSLNKRRKSSRKITG